MNTLQPSKNLLLCVAGLLGATAVALGAFAAHGLEGLLTLKGYEGEQLLHRIDNFQTGARYQLHAAAALLAIGLLGPNQRRLTFAAWMLAAGALVFSGLLYALALSGDNFRWLGAVVPMGGLAMIIGWGVVAVAGFRGDGPTEPEERALGSGIVRVEELLTHQQRLLHDLNDVVTTLRNDADEAEPRIATLEDTVRRLVELQEAAEDLPGEKPPHY